VNTIGDTGKTLKNGRRIGFNEYGEPMSLQEQLNALTGGKNDKTARELPQANQGMPSGMIAPDPSKV
jgi:hypothetical protein